MMVTRYTELQELVSRCPYKAAARAGGKNCMCDACTSLRVLEAQREEHYHGLASWVADYKALRKAGIVKETKRIRDAIQSAIDTHGLDATQVWGPDPDDPDNGGSG